MKQRQAVTAVTVQRYRHGSKKVKQQISADLLLKNRALKDVIAKKL